MIGFGQKTYVPDDNFEAYLEANGMGDGTAFNDSVYTSAIDSVSNLYVHSQNISDLTGIEDFLSLQGLFVKDNNLTTLDLSNNINLTNLQCQINSISNLDISNNVNLQDWKQ